jgi:hypothetical protein
MRGWTSLRLVPLICAGALPAWGDAQANLPWKLTVGEYAYTDYYGTDLNLRWRVEDTSAWVGAYSDPRFGAQTRAGADTSIDLGRYLQVQPSLQVASRGFVGGNVNLQAGASWFGIVGIGRTDAKPYFNLNFDPNDALTFGVGHQGADGLNYVLFVVADDRFHTQQRDWHANVQIPFGTSHATLDLLRKSGLSDAGPITAWGFSANWDWPAWFLRIAYDPYQNFSAQSAWRLATGVRF